MGDPCVLEKANIKTDLRGTFSKVWLHSLTSFCLLHVPEETQEAILSLDTVAL
jgi:hypothetical protein